MARINDLERGFEKTLAYAYGKHVVQGHLIMHNIDILGTEKQVTLLMALGDGAYNNLGEGAWGACMAGGEEPPPGGCGDVVWHTETQEDVTINGDNSVHITLDSTHEGYHSAWIRTEDVLTQNGEYFEFTVDRKDPSALSPEYTVMLTDYDPPTDIGNPFGHYSYTSFKYDLLFNLNTDFFSTEYNGSGVIGGPDGLFEAGDVFRFSWEDDTIVLYQNGVAIFTWDEVPSGSLHLAFEGGTSWSSTGNPNHHGKLSNVQFCTEGGEEESPETTFCPGVQAVYYAGRLIDPDNWHYHPGTFSTGADDPIQGVDSFFPDGITYSGTAYIAIRLPVGIADDADPSKVAIILETSCIADYDEDGNITEISYSANPARIKADMLNRRGLRDRINWDSFIQARDWYDELIPWTAGDVVNDYTDSAGAPTWRLGGNVQGTGGALSKTTAVNGYDNSSRTQERIVYGQDGSLEVTIGGTFGPTSGGAEISLIDSSGKAWLRMVWGNGHLTFHANGVSIDPDNEPPYDYPAVVGDQLKLSVESGNFKFYQNDVVINPPQGLSIVPLDTDLFGHIILWGANSGISSSFFVGQTVVSSDLVVTEIPRFEAHPAFTAPVDLTTALDFVDSLCASDTQDAGNEIIFLTPATPSPRTSVFTFTEDENVVSGTLRVYRRDIRERPNRLSAQFRNLNRVYLDQDEVFDSRDELFDEVGYIVDPGALNFASMNGSQAQRLIKFNMRRMSDNDVFCDLTGMADSLKLLPGDIVTVISDKMPDAAPKDFIILTASRASGENTAYERSFTMQEWFADDYSDNDAEAESQVISSPIPSEFDPPDAPVVVLTEEIVDPPTEEEEEETEEGEGFVSFVSWSFDDQAGDKRAYVPPGTEEDDIILAAVMADSADITPSAGWNLIDTHSVFDSDFSRTFYQTMYWRLAGASEPAYYTFGITHNAGISTATYRGCDTTDPIDNYSMEEVLAEVDADMDMPSVTVGRNGSRLVVSAFKINISTWTKPSGFSQRMVLEGHSIFDKSVNSGASGVQTFSTSFSGSPTLIAKQAIMMVFQPPA